MRSCKCGGIVSVHSLVDNRSAWTCKECGRYEIFNYNKTDESMVTITKKFFMDNATERGAWTRRQVEILGVTWPMQSGWQNELIGKKISQETADAFAEAKNITASVARKIPAQQQNLL